MKNCLFYQSTSLWEVNVAEMKLYIILYVPLKWLSENLYSHKNLSWKSIHNFKKHMHFTWNYKTKHFILMKNWQWIVSIHWSNSF